MDQLFLHKLFHHVLPSYLLNRNIYLRYWALLIYMSYLNSVFFLEDEAILKDTVSWKVPCIKKDANYSTILIICFTEVKVLTLGNSEAT